MINLEMVLEILYKRISVQDVIGEKIRYNCIEKQQFVQIANVYLMMYSEDEIENLFQYYLFIFKKNQRGKTKVGLNVFEILQYVASKVLVVSNNEIICDYAHMQEWRKITAELSEDLIVAAYMANNLSDKEVKNQGFFWKKVIGHNNPQLNALMKRGISENHFHLMGSAPIFHISWISLMNNIYNSNFKKFLESYDGDRRYTNIGYTTNYGEESLSVRAIQASIIRLLLYGMITKNHFRIGAYCVKLKSIESELKLPAFQCDIRFELDEAAKQKFKLKIKENLQYTLKEAVCLLVDFVQEFQKQQEQYGWEEIWKENFIWYGMITGPMGKLRVNVFEAFQEAFSSGYMDFSKLIWRVWHSIEHVNLDDVEFLFEDKRKYFSIWDSCTLENVKNILKDSDNIYNVVPKIQLIIDSFRMNKRLSFNEKDYLDYALTESSTYFGEKERINYIFSGERWLLYEVLRKIYKEENLNKEYANLFYAYVLIKESIRSEIVQSNKNVGFKNFQKYQDRKQDLLADHIYSEECAKYAVEECLLMSNIKHMEIRITPKETAYENHRMITWLDNLIDVNGKDREKFFYTVHFIKNRDNDQLIIGNVKSRHFSKRKQISRIAEGLIELRENRPLSGKRIYGIDAAANEIGCRPEVFAVAFRRLKQHRASYLTVNGKEYLPQLRATYHVGEDFLDVADGLRAIEEAILFLNLEAGDRLGHAMALGVNVRQWYKFKNNRIVLPMQDYLDNLAWIYHKIFEYDLKNFENLKDWILGQFTKKFNQIYMNNITQQQLEYLIFQNEESNMRNIGKIPEVNIFNYYNAWKLRGDNPKFYEKGYFEYKRYKSIGEKFQINHNIQKSREIRKSAQVTMLYYFYHYNTAVKDAGKIIEEVLVSNSYITAVEAIQKEMQKRVAQKGISIEVNPSSNLMIGTFKQYNQHPVVCLYNKSLVHERELLDQCAQIPVSINTDDQGVFGTSLENEYALLARDLEDAKDENGCYLYNKTDIYEWLDRIRVMGNEQSFAAMDSQKEENE